MSALTYSYHFHNNYKNIVLLNGELIKLSNKKQDRYIIIRNKKFDFKINTNFSISRLKYSIGTRVKIIAYLDTNLLFLKNIDFDNSNYNLNKIVLTGKTNKIKYVDFDKSLFQLELLQNDKTHTILSTIKYNYCKIENNQLVTITGQLHYKHDNLIVITSYKKIKPAIYKLDYLISYDKVSNNKPFTLD